MFSGFGDEATVFRIRPVQGEDRGESFLEYGAAAERTRVFHVSVQPASGVEFTGPGRDATQAQFAVLDFENLPGFWEATDRVEIDGTAYQIEGDVQDWPSPTGGLSHIQLLVNRWEG